MSQMAESPLGWARLYPVARPFCRPMPRHGAWYPVVRELGERVVLEVASRRVAIAANLVEVRDRRPVRFTVVRRAINELNPFEGTPNDLGRVYAVCPHCDTRRRLFGEPVALSCAQCGHQGEIAWWETG
jgi:Fe-S-cluster formation regulator IscX/YfhJ